MAEGKTRYQIAREWADAWGSPASKQTLYHDVNRWAIHNDGVAAALAKSDGGEIVRRDPTDQGWVDHFLGAYRQTVEESEFKRPNLQEALRRANVAPADFWAAFRRESPLHSESLANGKKEIDAMAEVMAQRLHDELAGNVFVVHHDSVMAIPEHDRRAGRAYDLMKAVGPKVYLPPTQHELRVSGGVEVNHEHRMQLIKPLPGTAARIEDASHQLFLPRAQVEVNVPSGEVPVEAVYEEMPR